MVDTFDPCPFADRDGGLEASIGRALGGPVAGIDEAGRGPLAGPVVAAAVMLVAGFPLDGLNDSKKLTAARRAAIHARLLRDAVVGIGIASPTRIDATNIRSATLWAMAQAARALSEQAAFFLIDGRDVPPGLPASGQAIIKGDARVASIAAASIVAKQTRDAIMRRMGGRYPGYGLERHMGYGTEEHRQALMALGPMPHHRKTFQPLRSYLGKTL